MVWGVLSKPVAINSVMQRHVELTPSAHGKDVVTVILADFRGFDTLGEITVVGVGFWVLLVVASEAGAMTVIGRQLLARCYFQRG